MSRNVQNSNIIYDEIDAKKVKAEKIETQRIDTDAALGVIGVFDNMNSTLITTTGLRFGLTGRIINGFIDTTVEITEIIFGTSATRTALLYCRRFNNVVDLVVHSLSGTLTSTSPVSFVQFGTVVPEAYRPSGLRRTPGMHEMEGDFFEGNWRVASTGGLTYWPYGEGVNFPANMAIRPGGHFITYLVNL